MDHTSEWAATGWERTPAHEPRLPLLRYRLVRASTEQLAAPLSAEDQQIQSMPDASPVKWHLAHTTWFFETFLLASRRGHRPFHPRYGYLFNSYYDAIGPRHERPRRGLLSRPPLEEILRYRHHVDVQVGELIEQGLEPGALEVLELGMHHEQQHQELILTDVKHALYANPLRPAYREEREGARADAPPLVWHELPGGTVEVGARGSGFAFDNELPRHPVLLEPFALASRPVTCGEMLDFIADGGYRRPELWSSDGFAKAHEQGWTAPLYWERDDGGFSQFTLAGMRPVRPEEPLCHVSWYEADAVARWAGARLPTEEEWESATAGAPREGNFVESGLLQPRPAPAAEGLSQMLGDVWEWTRSAYGPYPGYRPPAGALGEYNGKFMVNQLVLRGGSCATPASHMRPSYRNFFYPDARWQFSGVRLARDLE